MMSFSTNQWAVLVLILLLGWLLGLASRSGGAKWRRAYEAERAERLALVDAQEARIAAANARIAELERTPPAPSVVAAARGDVENLTLIRGIDRNEEVRLNDAGFHRFGDIARMTPADENAVEGRLGYEPGRIARERWREQAEMLAAGRAEEHRRTFI